MSNRIIRKTPIVLYPVTSVFGRTGAVLAVSGDYDTSLVPESGNLYFTNARAVSALAGQNISIFTNDVPYLTNINGAVTNSTDTTLTRSGSGPYTLGLNLSNANTWLAKQTVSLASLAATTADGFALQNPTAALTGARVQASPAIRYSGAAWDTTASASKHSDFRKYNLPVTGAGGLGNLTTDYSSDGGTTWGKLQTLGQSGLLTSYGQHVIEFGNANSTVGDASAHLTLSQPGTGTPTMIGFRFNGAYKAYMRALSSGSFAILSSGSISTIDFYNLTFGLIAQVYNNGIYNNYSSINGGRVTAGSANIAPPSVLTVYGSTGRQTTLYTTSATLADADGDILVDASGAFACGGTPITQCSGYSDQTNCELNTSHGSSCTWTGSQDCTAFNGTDSATCTTGHPGCTWDTASCSAFNNNSATCTATTGCTYPGNTGNCSLLGEASCLTTSPCSTNYTDCTLYSDAGGDGTACFAANALCAYDAGTGACTGAPFHDCSGTYDNGDCTGTYDLNTCSGLYGTCTGTVSCSNFNADPTGCTAETGCAGTTEVDITLQVNPILRQIPLMDVGASGSCVLLPGAGQTLYLNRANTALSSYDFTNKSISVTYYSTVWYITTLK